MDFKGLPISIENGKSSCRQWYNPDVGNYGITRMDNPYGYIRGTLGVDGDAVDVYVGPDRDALMVYIIHQTKAPDFTEYDEDKCMLGFPSADAAKEAYLKHYNDPRFLGPITAMTFDEFKEKLVSHNGRMIKSHVSAYTRITENGRLAFVPAYDNRKTKTQAPITAPNDRDNFGMIQGEIAAKAGMPPGPVKLFEGEQVAEHRGFGKAHISAQHGTEIRAAGYRSEEEFVADVVKNFTAIYSAGGNRYALVAEHRGKPKVHIVEIRHQAAGDFYSVVTGYIADRQAVKRDWTLLWRRGGLRKGAEEIIKRLGDELGVDWDEIDLDDFIDGMWYEEEAGGTNAIEEAKRVVENLRQDPKHYARMEKSLDDMVVTLRDAITAEYEAIKIYTRMADSIGNELARKTLLSIIDEERVHAGEFLRVLQILSPEEARLYREGAGEVDGNDDKVQKALAWAYLIRERVEKCPWAE
jgi:hypothetical protein